MHVLGQREHIGAAGEDNRDGDKDAHQCLAGDQAGREQHALAMDLTVFFVVLGAAELPLDDEGEQAAEEDRYHQFDW